MTTPPETGDPANGPIPLSGIGAKAEIRKDQWGITHIRADSRDDLFFAQGYNIASERLWQIDLWRKKGLGLLAADFGPGYLAQDHATRHFVYRGDMAEEYASYAPDAKEICTAFTNGINSYIDRVMAQDAPMPEEFTLFGTRPAYWKPEDVVRVRTHCLIRNAISEVQRAYTLSHSGKRAEALRKHLEPPVVPTTADDLDLGTIPLELVQRYQLAVAPPTFAPARLAATMENAWKWRVTSAAGDVTQATDNEGSNNWAISPTLTETGRPLLASDPHRAHGVPSLRYMVHLTAPGIDVIGAGDPAAPGVIIGHSDHAAFCLTTYGADQQDVYVYDLNPDDPLSYRYADGWEKMQVVEEPFEVKGQDPITLPLHFTRHGPVMLEETDANRAYAIRSVWSDAGTSAYMASLSVMRAQSVEEYRSALVGWGAPTMNHMWADIEGNIVWQSVGWSPIRPNWEGLLPVPGDGRYEWDGYIPPLDMPHSINPGDGILYTANEMNLSDEWQRTGIPIGNEWIDGSRAQRVREVLYSRDVHTVAESQALQSDLTSIPARRLQEVLKGIALDGDAARAADHILGWDCWLSADSSAGALFEVWFMAHLIPELYETVTEGDPLPPALRIQDVQSAMDVMERPDAWCDGNPATFLQAIASKTLASAWADMQARLGPDPAAWEWGNIHKLTMKHAVSRAFPEVSERYDIGPIPLGGSGSTPANAIYRSDFSVLTGASVRMVFDVGNWDACQFINLPGQSGDPDNPAYSAFVETWTGYGYLPLVFSRAAVDKATVSMTTLAPA